MFLKSLSMKGFKSFADPTVLEFEPGITVVVGPNGSGKSNVVDAVTWVLGAQGPRALRSQKMEDVIFAGTSSRPALGRAEVSLTIDNESGRLPVAMAEVTITRTLFRSGESEYAINGTPCRLLDIQELLSDSGVGRQQHMIVGQGQLDTVLNARPEDRRAIVEEAAGVLKHRRRRERAERRLAATQENLERLGDLVREVRRQIRPLERQAAAARSHGELTAELRAVRLHLAGGELDELAARRSATTEALARVAEDERRLRVAVTALDEEAAAATAALSSSREVDLASTLGRVQGLVERARGTSGVLRERARSLASALDAAADVDVVSTLEAEGARLAAELVAAEEEASRLVPEEEELGASLRQLAADEAAHERAWGRDRRSGRPRSRWPRPAPGWSSSGAPSSRGGERWPTSTGGWHRSRTVTGDRPTPTPRWPSGRPTWSARRSGWPPRSPPRSRRTWRCGGRRTRPSRPPMRRSRPGTGAPPAPRRWPVRSTSSRVQADARPWPG